MTTIEDIVSLSEYVYERTRDRLRGLDDAEYFWEPVAGCLSVRPVPGGEHRADPDDDASEPPPFTTVAWRLWHLVGCYGSERNPNWLGLDRPRHGFDEEDPAPATAADALEALDRAYAFWADLLRSLAASSWSEPLGPVAGPYAEHSKAAFVLHQLDEQIHHGAELGVLRDLYRHGAGSTDPGSGRAT
jgi:hypothetical protein